MVLLIFRCLPGAAATIVDTEMRKLFACRSSRQIWSPFKKQMFLPFKAAVIKQNHLKARHSLLPHTVEELTVMTDTPAEVLLSFGAVLKCFLIFPATDNWFSFSDTPSSWEMQTKRQRQICLRACSHLILTG